ncbi:hypothetical protein CAAN1_14S01398 [[Candida] anglica]|uniref:Protein kinase domain-containing protein n=1 Tax=[Candida] anglica TaxID=148631 RepID=A0ABP0EIT2_9ASCO
MPLTLLPLFEPTPKKTPPTTTTSSNSKNTPLPRAAMASSLSLDGCYINNQYRFVKKIGAGTYGLIYLVEDVHTQTLFAAKMVLKKPPPKQAGRSVDVDGNKRFIQTRLHDYFHSQPHQNVIASELDLNFLAQNCAECTLLREVALHLRVHEHPNIINIHKVLNVDKVAIVIIMDYYSQGDLFHNIIDKQIFVSPGDESSSHSTYRASEFERQLLMKNVILQLIDAIKYCASKSIFHCDLKPENIMINYNPSYRRRNHARANIIDYNEVQVVLIDFGLAMDNPLVCCNVCRGSSFYMAPERITNYTSSNLVKTLVDLTKYQSVDVCDLNQCTMNKYFPTLAGDIWSLAVLFINITCSRNPWPMASIESINDNQAFQNYILHNPQLLREILPISKQFNDLLNKVFVMDPSSRLSLEELAREMRRINFFHDYSYVEDEDSEENASEKSAELFSPNVCSESSEWLQTPLTSINHIEGK